MSRAFPPISVLEVLIEAISTAFSRAIRRRNPRLVSRPLPWRRPLAYAQIVESNPDAAEAGYARSRMKGILNPVVPGDELWTSETALALGHLRRRGVDTVGAVSQ